MIRANHQITPPPKGTPLVQRMNDITPTSEYESLISETLAHWKEAIYDGVLVQHVMPAVQIYAHASLLDIAEPPDVAGCFPLAPEHATLFDHYGNGIFARLGAACTSIRSALLAIQARTDGHSAIAISRRAHESLWQAFWLFNPDIDSNERVRRLLVLTGEDIKEALRVFSDAANPDVNSKLQEHLANITKVATAIEYIPRCGREEYGAYFFPRANDPLTASAPPVPDGVDTGALAWSMMSNMTHPNMVFDLIMQVQPGFQDQMDRLQMISVSSAMACVSNISTTLMEQAQLPDDKTHAVNSAFHQPVFAVAKLMDMHRERE